METTPEADALLAELLERSAIVADLDGPQIEAWVSGLFALFDADTTAIALVDHCQGHPSATSALICRAVAELCSGIDDEAAAHAMAVAERLNTELPAESAQIGASVATQGWIVQAPFGRSIVLGFDNPLAIASDGERDDPQDLRHSILAEIDDNGSLLDLQLTGSPQALVEEAVASEDRVTAEEVDAALAVSMIVAAWPGADTATPASDAGPGIAANQQFVRRRIVKHADVLLPMVQIGSARVDVRRGMDDAEYADANRAALRTLQAAVGLAASDADSSLPGHRAWIGVIRGDGGDLSSRERDALLWLEWADWLGVAIGLLRAGAGADATGASFVDHVNRCPEVSSTIEKSDRDYAEWAFEVAIDLLTDVELIAAGELTDLGHQTLGPAVVAAWS